MSVFQNTFDIQYKDSIQMSVKIFSADDQNIFLTRELQTGRWCSALADIGPKQDNLVARPLEIHRQDVVELKYRVTVSKSIKTI